MEPWIVTHKGHRAWAQRAFMIGDFMPGRRVSAWYVVDPQGRSAAPESVPLCEGCGREPRVDDLEVIEVATKQSGFLARIRMMGRWPRPTDTGTCWWCNCPGLALETDLLCVGCAKHLAGR